MALKYPLHHIHERQCFVHVQGYDPDNSDLEWEKHVRCNHSNMAEFLAFGGTQQAEAGIDLVGLLQSTLAQSDELQ